MLREYLQKKRMQIVEKYAGGPADLDLGAGKSPKGKVGLDVLKQLGLHIVADLEALPIRDGCVESVVSSHAIEHVKNPDKVLDDIARILQKNGIAIFFLPDDDSVMWRLLVPIWSKYYDFAVIKGNGPTSHAQLYGFEKFRGMINRHFEIVEIGKMNLGMEIYAVCRSR